MSAEVQAAVDQLIAAFILMQIPILGALGWSISRQIKERNLRRVAEGRLIVRETGTKVEREELLNDFTKDCLKRVSDLARELHEVRAQMDTQEAAHEQDRTRWIEERNAMQTRIDALERAVHEMQDERAERELVIGTQSGTIQSLQERIERQERRIRTLEEEKRGYDANQF